MKTLKFTPLEPLEVPRPVHRIRFIVWACKDLRVLDLGAMDETALDVKRGRGTWLHEEIGRSAARVEGIDNSPQIPADGFRTGGHSVIRRGDVTDPTAWVAALQIRPEVLVAGELIEHLENPLQFLTRLKATDSLSGATLILSTPNATAVHNVLVGLLGRESTHHDHLCIFSFKTLATLCERAGFDDWKIIPYYSSFSEMKSRHSGFGRLLIVAGERLINLLEWLFPLLSFGYLVQVTL